jgi:hypothetical protein
VPHLDDFAHLEDWRARAAACGWDEVQLDVFEHMAVGLGGLVRRVRVVGVAPGHLEIVELSGRPWRWRPVPAAGPGARAAAHATEPTAAPVAWREIDRPASWAAWLRADRVERARRQAARPRAHQVPDVAAEPAQPRDPRKKDGRRLDPRQTRLGF